MIILAFLILSALAGLAYFLLAIVKVGEWSIMQSAERKRREEERRYYALPKILGGDGN